LWIWVFDVPLLQLEKLIVKIIIHFQAFLAINKHFISIKRKKLEMLQMSLNSKKEPKYFENLNLNIL